MTQYNMKQGLKHFGQIGVSAIEKEVCHIFTMDILEPDDPKDLSREDRRSVIAYMMFLKEKQDGTINARGFYNGRIQQNYMTKEETRSTKVIQ